MRYRQSNKKQISRGVDIPVCQWPKVKTSLILACLIFLQAACGEQSDRPIKPQAQPEPSSQELQARPARFNDRMVFPALAVSQEPAEQRESEQRFEMLIVPGDPEKGIEPFYLSKTEVRLEMFYPWAMGYGMGWDDIEAKRRTGFYPSQYAMLFGTFAWRYEEHRPAFAMSRTVAEAFCKTLGELTGRNYRLPTEAEWEHALRLGGGVPRDRASLLEMAHLESEASWTDEAPFGPAPDRVGVRSADRLGLHDMIGNAAEWVTDTGAERVVRGGHFALPVEDFKEDWRAVEDIEVWNESYPQRPVPSGLYRDFPYTGIRLACDADQAPQNPQRSAETGDFGRR